MSGVAVRALATRSGISAGAGSDVHPRRDLIPAHVDFPASLATPFRYSFPRTATAEVIDARATGSIMTINPHPERVRKTAHHTNRSFKDDITSLQRLFES